MIDDILKSQLPIVELTPEQVVFVQLDAIGEQWVRRWLARQEIERQGRSEGVERVANVTPKYEILKTEEGDSERKTDYHEPN